MKCAFHYVKIFASIAMQQNCHTVPRPSHTLIITHLNPDDAQGVEATAEGRDVDIKGVEEREYEEWGAKVGKKRRCGTQGKAARGQASKSNGGGGRTGSEGGLMIPQEGGSTGEGPWRPRFRTSTHCLFKTTE